MEPDIIRAAGTFVIGIGCGVTFRSWFSAAGAMLIGALIWNVILGA